MSKVNVGELKRALARLERGPGKRIPSKLKQEVALHARERLAAGAGYREVGQELGLTAEAARRWSATASVVQSKRSKIKRALVAVEVVPEQTGAVLVSPSGYRVEGLGLEQLASLLRALS